MVRTMSKRRAGLVVVILAMTAACSPTEYQKPVAAMDAALDGAIASVGALDQTLTAERNAQLRAALLSGNGRLQAAGDGCTLAAPGCALAVRVRTAQGPKSIVYPARSVMPTTGLAELKAYTAKLAAIISADTARKVSDSANDALLDLVNMENALQVATAKPGENAPQPSPIAQYSEPVGAFAGWLAGTYVDSVKVSALADATKAADPIVQRLAAYHRTAARAAADYELGAALTAFTTAAQAYDDASGQMTAAIVDAYVAAGTRLNGVLSAQAAAPLDAFGTAHHKLMQQLNGEGEVTLAQALAAIDDLTRRTAAFQAVVQSFKDAAKPPELRTQ